MCDILTPMRFEATLDMVMDSGIIFVFPFVCFVCKISFPGRVMSWLKMQLPAIPDVTGVT